MKLKRTISVLLVLILVFGMLPAFSIDVQATTTNAEVTPMVAGGEYHSVLLKSDGTVWTWGGNQLGQLGDGSFIDSHAPIKVDIDNVVQIAAGSWHDDTEMFANTYVLKSDGTVWAWGGNERGQLGIGNYETQNKPVKIDISDVKQISSGHGFAVALKNDGTVWYWGNTYHAKPMGLPATTVPKQLTVISDVKHIQTGDYNIAYLKNDGTLWVQGRNYYGQLGQGTRYGDKDYPIQINIDSFKQVCTLSGSQMTGVILSDNTLWGCGDNRYQSILPDGNNYVSSLTIMNDGQKYRFCDLGPTVAAINTNNQLEMWGSNGYGQIGNGRTEPDVYGRYTVLEDVLVAGAPAHQTIAIKTNGDVYTWGRNDYGQLGDGTTEDKNVPTKININAFYTDDSIDETDKFINSHAFLQELTKIQRDKYAIIVQDSQGNPVEGVDVSWTNLGLTVNEVTTKDGVVYFDKTSVGEPLITAAKENYIPYTNEGTNYQKSDKGYDIITLYTEAEGEYRLSSAQYIQDGRTHDILTGTKRLSLCNSSSTFGLQCKVAGGSAEGYKIIQGNRTIAQSSDGQFENLSVGNFFEKEQVYVEVITPNGDEVRTPINLQFVKDESSQGDTLKLGGDKLEFTVGEDVPFVGGGKFTFDIPPLPLDFYFAEDTVHVGINIEFPTDDKSAFEKKRQDVKRLLNTAQYMNAVESSSGHSIGNTLQSELNFLMKDKNNKAKWGPVDVDWNFIGYGEGKLDENGLAEINAYLCLSGSVDTTLQGPTIVVIVVPVTYSIKFSAEGEFGCEFTYDMGTGTAHGDLAFKVTPGLKAFGGVGIGKYVGAGAYGSAKLPFEIQLMGTTITPGLNYVDLTGELGLKAYLGPWTYEKPWKYNTWHLYTRTGYSKQTPMMLKSASAAVDLTDEDQYYLEDLSYLEDQSEWLGYGGGISLFSVTSDTTTANELTPLQIGTYRNMQPVIGAAGETPVMVWVTANTDRGDYNYPQLVYSVYQYGAWQEPMPVDDNDTLDSAHTLYTAENGTLWLVYQDTAEGYNTADLSDFAASQTIRVARFDEATGACTDFVTVSEPGVFSRTPVIAEQNGEVTVMWVANTDNSYFGENNTNTLCYAQYQNGTWGEAQVLASGLNAITETAIGNHNGVLSAAVITDGDNDLSTTDDRVLWLYEGLGQAQEIASGNISAVTFAQLPSTQTSDLLWSNGSSLMAHDTGAVLENSALAGGFTVMSDRIIYNGADGENKSNLFAQIYDNGTWTTPVHVTVQEQYLQSYAAAQIGDQTYIAAAQAVVDIAADSVDETCTLSWAVLSGRTDAAITAVDVDYSAEAPGAEVPVYVDVANLGDTTISEYIVTIGTEISETVTTSLAPGETTTVELLFPLGETVATTDYIITVIAENDGDDTNDTSTVTIGHSDLSVYTEFLQAGENRTMLVKVANEGAVSADGTLSVTSEAGEPKTVTVDTLEPGEFSLYRIEVTSDLLGGAQAGLLTATVTPNATEWNQLNDQSTSYVEAFTPTAEMSTSVEKTSMVLGNDLSIMFAFTADDIASTDNYATITKSYADGTADRVERIEQSAWGDSIVIGGKNYYAISFDGVAAKEMTDEVQVQIFNADGVPISEVFTDSIRDYAMRMIGNGTSVQMFVDMLVYGAEAQKQFGDYAIDDLATSQLTAEQLAQATQTVSYENKLVADDGYRASSLILESNIQLAVLFGGIDQTMTAEVSFTDHYGDIKSYTVSGSDFEPVTYKGEDCYSITVDKLVVADGRQPVSITVKDADGNVVASATDSVESYIARMSSTGTLYEAIMKFSDSAAAGLKN